MPCNDESFVKYLIDLGPILVLPVVICWMLITKVLCIFCLRISARWKKNNKNCCKGMCRIFFKCGFHVFWDLKKKINHVPITMFGTIFFFFGGFLLLSWRYSSVIAYFWIFKTAEPNVANNMALIYSIVIWTTNTLLNPKKTEMNSMLRRKATESRYHIR